MGLTGMLSGMGVQSNMRGTNQSATAGTYVNATSRVRQVAHLYQKGLRVYNAQSKYQKYQDVMELINLLNFDPRSLRAVVGQLTSLGFNELLDAGPTKVISQKLTLPPAVMRRLNKVWDFFWRMGLGHSKVQEMLGEIATGLIIKTLDFDIQELQLHSKDGPDQVAKHNRTGLWGIFEAKGGKGGLGTKVTNTGGTQMSGKWISVWLDRIIQSNANTQAGDDLRDSKDDVMLAAITRLRVEKKGRSGIRATFEVAAQKYEGDDSGNNMKPWGKEWYFLK